MPRFGWKISLATPRVYFLAEKGWCKSTAPARCRCLAHQQVQCEKTDLWTLSLAGLSLGKKEKETICTSSSAETELSNERQSIFKAVTWAFSFHLNVAKGPRIMFYQVFLQKWRKLLWSSSLKHLTSISNTPSSPTSLGQQSLGNEKQSLWWCFPQWAALPVSDLSFSTVKWEIMFLFFPY